MTEDNDHTVKAGRGLAGRMRAVAGARSNPVVRDTVLTTGFNIVGKGIGFGIPVFLAAWFGVGAETDAFFFAYGLVLLMAGIFSPVVESVIVPFIVEARARNEAEVKSLIGSALVLAALGLAALGTLLFLVSKPLLALVTNFPQESLDLISRLLLETIPLLVLLVATSLLAGALNAYKLFYLPAVSPAIRAVVAIAFIFALRGRLGVHSIAIGYCAGELVRFVALFARAAKSGIAPSISSIGFDAKVYQFLTTASYQITGMAILVFSPVVNKTMASWTGAGGVSILEYADRLYEIPVTLIARGLFVVLLSHWSVGFYGGLEQHLKRDVMRTAKIVGAGALVLSVALILMRAPLVGLIYGRGAFRPEHLPAVGGVWAIYLIGLGPMMFGRVFAQAHLVLKNTRLLMLAGIMNFALNIVLNLALIGPLGINGLALSTTLTHAAVAVVLALCFLGRAGRPKSAGEGRG